MGAPLNLIGLRFGRLIVESLLPAGNRQWICRCDCGERPVIFQGNLVRGYTKSCGCLNRQLSRARCLTHGKSHSREHRIWKGMRARCYNRTNPNFSNYGGRGVGICDRWRNSFENFIADMGVCPTGLTIERINNDGNYEPGNCRWASRREQSGNKRNLVFIQLYGTRRFRAEWERALGLPLHALYKIEKRHQLSPRAALLYVMRTKMPCGGMVS